MKPIEKLQYLYAWHSRKVSRVAKAMGVTRPTIYAALESGEFSAGLIDKLNVAYTHYESIVTDAHATMSLAWGQLSALYHYCFQMPNYSSVSGCFELHYVAPSSCPPNVIGYDWLCEYVGNGSDFLNGGKKTRQLLNALIVAGAFGEVVNAMILADFTACVLGYGALSSRNRSVLAPVLEKAGITIDRMQVQSPVEEGRWWDDPRVQVYFRRAWPMLISISERQSKTQPS